MGGEIALHSGSATLMSDCHIPGPALGTREVNKMVHFQNQNAKALVSVPGTLVTQNDELKRK